MTVAIVRDGKLWLLKVDGYVVGVYLTRNEAWAAWKGGLKEKK